VTKAQLGGRPHVPDPVAESFLLQYAMARIGTAGMSGIFTWIHGRETPQRTAEAFLIIHSVHTEDAAQNRAPPTVTFGGR